METLIQYFETIPSQHRALLISGGITLFWLIENAFPFFKFKYNKWHHAGINIFFTLTTIVINFVLAFILIKAAEFGRAFLAENDAAVTDAAAAHFISRFDSWLVGPYEGARELVAETSARYTTALLTNMSAMHWPRVEEFGLHIGPKHFVKSYEVGIMKPHAAYFQKALQMIAVDAQNTVFFDDSERNVAAAKAVGMQAYCLIGTQAVRAKMIELGLLA